MSGTIIDRNMAAIRETIGHMIRETFAHVTFTDVWVQPRESSYGDEVLEIWAIYDGVAGQLQSHKKLWFRTRVADALWDLGVDASPKLHFITKSDAGDWRPEGV